MDKSTVSKLANSTFTSQFFMPEKNNPSENQCLVPIKNNRVELLHAMVAPQHIQPKEQQKTLLMHAAFHSSPASALYLLRRGAQLDAEDPDGKTFFHICAYTGHIEVLKTVRNEMKVRGLQKLNEQFIAQLNQNNYKRTDAKGGNLKTSVSQSRKKTFQKMQQAITQSYINYVTKMIEDTYNYFTSCIKNTNRNCFHLASLNRYQRCFITMEYMFDELGDIHLHLDSHQLQYYQEVNKCFHRDEERVDPRLFQDTIALVQKFIKANELEDIKKNFAKKVDDQKQAILQSKDKDGQTPLRIASKDGCTGIINLIRKVQTPKLKKSEDKEDLIKVATHNLARSHIMDICDASKQADSKTMSFLLSCGQSINKKKTIFGTFALLQAIKSFEVSRNIDPIRMLIQSGAQINEQDTNGWTVLHHACEKGHKEIIQLLLNIWAEGKTKKILLNKLTNKNYHILHLAAMNNHPSVIQYLLTSDHCKKLELNTNAVDGDRCTMLHHAARKGAIQAIKKIVELCPGILYQLDVRNNSALHYAAMNDHVNCIKYLLYYDADFDKLSKIANTKGKLAKDMTVNKKPFENVFRAAKAGDVNLVRKMVSQTPQFKEQATIAKQRTLLIFAVLNQHLLVVKYLIDFGVNQSHQDKTGKTAKDYAEQSVKAAKTKQEQVVAKNIAALLA